MEQNDADTKTETSDCANELRNRIFSVAGSVKDLPQLIKSQSNRNTRRNTKWSVEMFNKWRESREIVPYIKEMNAEILNYSYQLELEVNIPLVLFVLLYADYCVI